MSSPLSCEDAENLMSQCNPWRLWTIEQSRPATFIFQMMVSPSTACRIVVSRVWHLGIRFVLARRVERCGNVEICQGWSQQREKACKESTSLGAWVSVPGLAAWVSLSSLLGKLRINTSSGCWNALPIQRWSSFPCWSTNEMLLLGRRPFIRARGWFPMGAWNVPW